MSSFRDELLRLLREDEGFRIEVMRLLGIINVNAALNQLIESVNKLTKAIEDLKDEVRKLWEENHRIWEEIGRLREENRKMWEEISRLREENQKIWENIQKMWEEIHKLREENHRIWEEMGRLREENQKIWEEIRRLREENQKIWEEIRKLREEVNKLWEENHKIWEEIRKIWEEIHGLRKSHEDLTKIVKGVLKDLGGLSRTVGKLVEQNIRHYLPAWIRETYGITVDRVRRLKVNNVAEFDGYVETEDKVLLMEIKTTLRTRDIKDMAEKIEKYRAQAPSGKTIIPMIIYTIEGERLEKLINTAKLHGIMLIKHYGEYEFELINQ
jgi:chromosome segregation ATPase